MVDIIQGARIYLLYFALGVWVVVDEPGILTIVAGDSADREVCRNG
jgi:hypothetical protein